jgi:hypothetical protein
MERGELQANTAGLTNLTSSRAEWVRDGKIRVLMQYTGNAALNRDNPILKGVPTAIDLVPAERDRKLLRFLFSKYRMARVIFAAPGVPAERIRALRSAFDATVKDPAFLGDSKKAGLEINPVSGHEVTALIKKIYATPAETVERARSILLSGKQ